VTPAIAVRCAHVDIAVAVRAWLAQARLEPSSPITLAIEVGDPALLGSDGRAAFRQPGVVVRAGPPQGGVRIAWDAAPAVADLPPGATTARVVLSAAALARIDECLRTFLLTVLVLLLRRIGWHHIHAAVALDPRERGWLIAGNAEAGKSTTAALLASCGWGVGTDDVSFLAGHGERISAIAYRSPIALRPGGHRLVQRVAAAGGVLLPERRKVGYWPEELGGRGISRVEPEVILFTSVGNGGAVTQAEPLGQREALIELIRWSAWVILEPELAEEHLALLTALARQAQSYRVTLGRDLFARPARLAELVA
jgi:hypothetical protein